MGLITKSGLGKMPKRALVHLPATVTRLWTDQIFDFNTSIDSSRAAQHAYPKKYMGPITKSGLGKIPKKALVHLPATVTRLWTDQIFDFNTSIDSSRAAQHAYPKKYMGPITKSGLGK